MGVSLVAEVMPDRARPRALGWLQALSAVGKLTAALLSLPLAARGDRRDRQRLAGDVIVGVLPALLSLFIFKRLKEPDKWKEAQARRLAALEQGVVGTSRRWDRSASCSATPTMAAKYDHRMLCLRRRRSGSGGIGFFSFD